MSDYKQEILHKKKLGNKTETAIKITRKNNKTITRDELDEIYDEFVEQIEKKYPFYYQLRVRALSPKDYVTIKSY